MKRNGETSLSLPAVNRREYVVKPGIIVTGPRPHKNNRQFRIGTSAAFCYGIGSPLRLADAMAGTLTVGSRHQC